MTPHELVRRSSGRSLAARPSTDPISEAITPYRQHREATLRADRESEDPLCRETYPRVLDSSKRVSVQKVFRNFNEYLAKKEAVTVMGRIRSRRIAGKNLIFLDLVNDFQRIQVMINKKCISKYVTKSAHRFSMIRQLIQVGDHIAVTGMATRTDTGHPSIEASQLPELLAPSLHQIPEKLMDSTRRTRERHVDMLVNRNVSDVLRLRAEITRHMRDHFHSRRFLEMQTPILAEDAEGAIARPFTTTSFTSRSKRNLALRIAPELWLKRLVVGGFDKVFEIGPAFRNEGMDATHNPEFTMCEFYSAYTNLRDLITETEELMCSLARHCQMAISKELVSLPPIDLARFARPFKQIEFVPALEEAMGMRLPKLSAEGALVEMMVLLRLAQIKLPDGEPKTLPKLLDQLGSMFLEPQSLEQPLFIVNHPSCMAPLAKSFLCPKTYQLVSARAELYVGGRELANMYEEENNPFEQRRKLALHRSLVSKPNGQIGTAVKPNDEPGPRPPVIRDLVARDKDFEESPEERRQRKEGRSSLLDDLGSVRPSRDDWVTTPLDKSYIEALEYGLPPTGGWGCGLERLVMLFSGAQRIGSCLSFGTLRNVLGISSPAEVDVPAKREASVTEASVTEASRRVASRERRAAKRNRSAVRGEGSGSSRRKGLPTLEGGSSATPQQEDWISEAADFRPPGGSTAVRGEGPKTARRKDLGASNRESSQAIEDLDPTVWKVDK